MLVTMFNFLKKVTDEGMKIDDNVRKAKESYNKENHIFFN